jgi:hypothetical protein
VGALPKRHVWISRLGEYSDFFWNIFEDPRDIAAQHVTNYEVVVLRPA